ncbi:hypothetical protein X777_03732 [Ooceraea biroi]|uniref:Odorant receptor n=1 Tax=Ooceraea biroi TaxID=2015173 RepID=A0A026VT63_OOCBI|nr:hypothetical protein X777_03732 [Ooceraea biroi]
MAICVVQQYFSINKILFRAVALWPYHRTKLVEFHLTFFLVILISFIAAQLATFLTTECTPHMAIKIFSLVLYFTLYLINYLSFRVNAHTIGCLLEKFQYICDELTDEGEIAIIKEYGNEAKRFTVIISLHQAMMLGSATEEYLVYVKCMLVILIYMFVGNYIGQEIADHHNHMFISIYNIKWYVTPLYIQRIILFLLQRGTRNFQIVVGGLFVVSMESATMLLSTSISYFTVLHSIQQNDVTK